jgi:hypothetical protein
MDAAAGVEREGAHRAIGRRVEARIGCARSGRRYFPDIGAREAADPVEIATRIESAAAIELQDLHREITVRVPGRIRGARSVRGKLRNVVAALPADGPEVSPREEASAAIERERGDVGVAAGFQLASTAPLAGEASRRVRGEPADRVKLAAANRLPRCPREREDRLFAFGFHDGSTVPPGDLREAIARLAAHVAEVAAGVDVARRVGRERPHDVVGAGIPRVGGAVGARRRAR